MAYRQPPMVVVLPDTTEQVSNVLKYCFEQGIKVVPRGSGTSLSGAITVQCTQLIRRALRVDDSHNES